MDAFNGLLVGRELQEAKEFFNTWEFDDGKFGIDYDNEWEKCNTRKAPDWCHHELASKFAAQPTWQPEIADPSDLHYRKKADCQYEFSLVKVVQQAALLFLNFHFVITQFNCSHPALRKTGGTSFEIWARRESALVHCFTSTLASAPGGNVSYEARCDLPDIPSITTGLLPSSTHHPSAPAPAPANSSAVESTPCVRLTALLQYEHYDAYSEALGSEALFDYQYPPSGYALVDEEEFCSRSNSLVPGTQQLQQQHLPPDEFASLEYVSGAWLAPSSTTTSTSTSTSPSLKVSGNGSSSSVSLFDWRVKTQDDAFLTAWAWRSGLWGVIIDYNYVNLSPYAQHWHSKLSRGYAQDSYRYSFRYLNSRRPSSLAVPHRGSYPKYASRLAGTNVSTDRQYYILGASHSRYNYDAVLELLFGAQVLPPDRKHDLSDYANWHFRGSLLAANFESDVRGVCTELQRQGQRKATLIFQFGAWDLLYSTLRRLINKPRHLNGLINTLQGVVNGSFPCGIDHIVWLTAVPYPNCYHDDGQCSWLRSARTNPAIAALNQALFAALPSLLTNASFVSFTVVDAFQILLPRLALNDQVEILCSNHMLCRIEIGPKDRKRLELAHTPGGEAVLEAVLETLYHRALR